MSKYATDQNLLFGLLALQNGLIDQVQLVAAFQAWTRDRARSLADHLVSRDDLDSDQRVTLEMLVALHLRKHGGEIERSLASLAIGQVTRTKLESLADIDIGVSLTCVASIPAESQGDLDPDRTASNSVGATTADGQRFCILRPHARGGLGEVFVARDGELNREVALKHIRDQRADDPISRARFVREAEITGGLEHPGIVPVYGLGTYSDGRPFYAMRFIRGDSLKEAIDGFHADESLRRDPGKWSLELRKLLRRFLDVCDAIDYAHSRGILHRDIKPANIILGKYGETLVVDWGLAKATGSAASGSEEGTLIPRAVDGSAETLPGSALGTPAYVCPEQAAGKVGCLGPRSDVYSLGATLYCLLSGRPAFEGNDIGTLLRAVQNGAFLAPRHLNPHVPPALEAIVLKAMARHADHRYSSARALAEDVEHWLADEPVTVMHESIPSRIARWARAHKTLATSAAMLLATAVVALLIGTILIGREQTKTRNALDAVIAAQKERSLARIDALLNANAHALPTMIEEFAGARGWIDPRLRELLRLDLPPEHGWRVRMALLPSDPSQADLLAGELLDRQIDEFGVIVECLEPFREQLSDMLWTEFRNPSQPLGRRLLAGMALARFEPTAQGWTASDNEFLATQLLDAGSDDQRDLRSSLRPIAMRLIPTLRMKFDDESVRESVREAAANALAEYARDDPALLADLVSRSSADQYRLLLTVISSDPARRGEAVRELDAIAGRVPVEGMTEVQRIAAGKQRARAAIALIKLGEYRAAAGAFLDSSDPEVLTQFSHQARERGLGLTDLIAALNSESNVRERFALLLTLGEFQIAECPEPDRSRLVARLSDWYARDPSNAVHGAAGWVLRAWNLDEKTCKVDCTHLAYDPASRRSWFVEKVNADLLTFVVCFPGEFWMGSTPSETDRDNDETLHRVALTHAFAIATHEVTTVQYARFQRATGAGTLRSEIDPRAPVVGVNWYEAVAYCRWLTRELGLAESDQCYDEPANQEKGPNGLPRQWLFHPERRGFRLPTEAEWEYACRAGTSTPFSFGSDRTLLPYYGWFQTNAGRNPRAWGQLRPNLLGIFDLHGNAVEWCHDGYLGYDPLPLRDPIGDPAAKYRVYRGGAWTGGARLCRSADRDLGDPGDRAFLGFRLARTLSER